MRYLMPIILVLGIFFVGCKSKEKVVKIAKEDIKFYLGKGACFGKCPVYTLEVYQSGRATLFGENNTDKLGKYEKDLSNEDLALLEKLFAKSDFASFQENYASNIPDLPAIIVGFDDGAGMKKVIGRENRPEKLQQLQFALEKIVDSDGWVLVESMKDITDREKPQEVNIENEIIIEPTPGTLVGKWIAYRSDVGVRLIKKIAPNLNYYLITYDTSKITPMEMLKTLQSDPKIVSAEFNKKTTKRR